MLVLTSVPSAIFLWLARLSRLRQPLVYVGFGAALGQAFASLLKAPSTFGWQLIAAGFAAGIIYWLVAERERRHAG
jgi:hypothetical protein